MYHYQRLFHDMFPRPMFGKIANDDLFRIDRNKMRDYFITKLGPAIEARKKAEVEFSQFKFTTHYDYLVWCVKHSVWIWRRANERKVAPLKPEYDRLKARYDELLAVETEYHNHIIEMFNQIIETHGCK